MKAKSLLTGALLISLVVAGCGAGGQNKPAQAEGKAPAAQTPATQTPAAQTPAAQAPAQQNQASAGSKSYAAVTEKSQASYAVKEKFLGKELNATAVGKTNAFTGELILEGGVIKPSTIQVDLSTLKSDEDRRDNRVRQALDTANHKYATFKITGAQGNPVLQDGAEVDVRLLGTMTIKGTEKPVVFTGKVKLAGQTITIAADTTFAMTSFGVTPPNIANFVAVTDEVKLTVNFAGLQK